MVTQHSLLYLFVGQDCPAKDAALTALKQSLVPENAASFNIDILYCRDSDLRDIQEKLLVLPAGAQRRLVVLKGLAQAKKDLKDFLLGYARAPAGHVVLVMDAGETADKDTFIDALASCCRVQRFGQPPRRNVFDLARSIETGRAAESLRILNELLGRGEKPEMILGGIRHALSRSGSRQKKISLLLLESDLAIKTGGLKPSFALEKLVVRLCAFK